MSGRYPSIGDYALIGDCRSAALVSRDGSLEWLCWPRFDSPSFFAALLDRDNGGRFSIRPVGSFDARRRYIGDTAVLETTFEAAGGRLRLLDLMPAASEAWKRCRMWPERHLLRAVECLSGEVEVEVVCDPRPRYGTVIPRLDDREALGLWYQHRAQALVLRSEIPLTLGGNAPGAHGRTTLRAGERRALSLSFADEEPAAIPSLGAEAIRRIATTIRWWRGWSSGLEYEGTYRNQVVRSALTVKLLSYAPSGAIVAAPTTSLPERIGGVRNWDYRYCWLRDASLTVRALLGLGCLAEATAFVSWILYSTRLSRPELQVLYDVHGETRLPERELEQLEGYAGSRPVRVGNAAANQLQLDVYGEVAEALYEFLERQGQRPGPETPGGGARLDRETRRFLTGIGRTVCERWREPDEGIWELRAGPRHHTYSKVMCWVALDRLLRLHERGRLEIPAQRYREVRDAIREEIEAQGFNPEIDSYVSVLGGEELDASLLLLARYGYAAPGSERMRSTCRAVLGRLGADGLLYRYRTGDGLPEGEGTFGIAGFWAVDCRCRQGDVDGAAAAFEKLLGYANDVGLYAEEIDPATGEARGNFPQAFTHVGLIDAALTLARPPAVGDEERGRR